MVDTVGSFGGGRDEVGEQGGAEPLGHHHDGQVGVGGGDLGDDRAVDHPHVGEAVDPAALVDDRAGVVGAAHPGGADGVEVVADGGGQPGVVRRRVVERRDRRAGG